MSPAPDPARADPGDALVPLDAIEAMISPRDAVLRFLPHRERRMVGAWCFVDVYGPWELADDAPGMTVPPHSHIGLQTVSWVVDGEVLHRDSVGSTSLVTPGHAAVMTAGRGIAHSENSPAGRPPRLHGVQLWVALPDRERDRPPSFELGGCAEVDLPGGSARVFVGELAGADSGTRGHTPLLGAELRPARGGSIRVPLPVDHEHLVLPLDGEASLDDASLSPRRAAYLPAGRPELVVTASDGARLLLLGGEPFAERIVMWWNFVARTHEEIAQAREQWNGHDARFGEVAHYPDDTRLPAPPLPGVRLRARGAAR